MPLWTPPDVVVVWEMQGVLEWDSFRDRVALIESYFSNDLVTVHWFDSSLSFFSAGGLID